jgi:hypothetical protein
MESPERKRRSVPEVRAVGFDLEAERLVAHRLDERIVVGRHPPPHDAFSVTGVAAAILVGVVADDRAARDEHVAIDDRLADPRVAPDRDAGMRMVREMSQKLCTRTLGQRMLP